jgi:hypothetical protein
MEYYGLTRCRGLAQSDPDYAFNNVDNHVWSFAGKGYLIPILISRLSPLGCLFYSETNGGKIILESFFRQMCASDWDESVERRREK